jgi:G3E family GTPase
MALPAILLTGFLGAGKTTLLNRILQYYIGRPERIAVLVNEFGAIGVDGVLVHSGSVPVYEVNNGSIFCVCVRDDFVNSLGAILDIDPAPDFILIEATGVSETRNLNSFLSEPPVSNRIYISENICVVDTLSFHKVHATLRAAREQVISAGVILMNKSNIAPEALIASQEALVRELNPEAPVIRWDGGPVDFSFLRGCGAGMAERFSSGGPLLVPPKNISSVSVEIPGIADREKLHAFLENLAPELLRAKGIVNYPDGAYLVELTLDGISERKLEDGHGIDKGFMALIGERLEKERVENYS